MMRAGPGRICRSELRRSTRRQPVPGGAAPAGGAARNLHAQERAARCARFARGGGARLWPQRAGAIKLAAAPRTMSTPARPEGRAYQRGPRWSVTS
jgi:hypothetical protein